MVSHMQCAWPRRGPVYIKYSTKVTYCCFCCYLKKSRSIYHQIYFNLPAQSEGLNPGISFLATFPHSRFQFLNDIPDFAHHQTSSEREVLMVGIQEHLET